MAEVKLIYKELEELADHSRKVASKCADYAEELNSKVTYKDKKLKVGKKYYYKIRAYQDTDEGTRYGKYCKITVTAG